MKMSISLSNLQRLKEFPISRTKVFLAHAAISPFPHRVCKAIQEYCHSDSVFGQWEYLYGETERRTRQYAAALLGGHEDEIAFIPSTSVGLSTVACGLPWQRGDNVVVADGDFPANIYPWLNLARLGVETRLITRHNDGAVSLDDIERTVDNNTRMVSLSSVNFVTGFKIDMNAIGEYLPSRGILFCIDAIQSLGALPFDSRYVDFASSSAHKWLLGPMGIGILYVKREHFDRLQPVITGWKSVKDNKKYLKYNLDFLDSAKRYEAGNPNGLGIVGLHAALELLMEAGIENIAKKLLEFRKTLIDTLTELGFEVISPIEPKNGSGIVSFTSNNQDIVALRQQLDSHNFVVSLRDALDGRKCIRVSPHFYNTDEDISAFLAELRAYQCKR